MCFWFGLEIPRLVYKKVFFKILNERFQSYLTFYPPKKEAPSLIRVEKNFEIRRTGYQRKLNFVLISKMCRSLKFGKRKKIIYRKTGFVGTFRAKPKSHEAKWSGKITGPYWSYTVRPVCMAKIAKMMCRPLFISIRQLILGTLGPCSIINPRHNKLRMYTVYVHIFSSPT
jgi:hypothetical protein